jgi:hypothetical protein
MLPKGRSVCYLLTLSYALLDSVNLIIFACLLPTFKNRDSAVGIATGYGLDDQGVGVRIPVGARIFTSPCLPDRLWGPPNLSNVYRGLFPQG